MAHVELPNRITTVKAVGAPRFPTRSAGGCLAYVAITTASPPWQVVLVVTDQDDDVIDMLPGAAVFAPPSWSPDGSQLMYVRGDSHDAEVMSCDLDNGGVDVLFRGEGVRSVTWRDDELLHSRGGHIYAGCAGAEDLVWEVPAAPGLLAYGSDDLYVTVDQIAVGPDGTLAAVERWYRQGLPPMEHVVVGGASNWTRVAPGRYPQWISDTALLFTAPDGRPTVLDQGPIGPDELAAHSVCPS